MREIKFRVWDKKVGRIKQPSRNILIDSLSGIPHWQYAYDEPIPMCDCVLMQFTGLKDKNGKEIYDGDIVKCHRPDEKLNFIAKVEHKRAGFYIQDLKQEELYWDFNYWTVQM